jgi:hypothetical protein
MPPKEQEKFICPIPCEGRETGPDGSVRTVYFPSCRPNDKVDSKENVVCVPGVRWKCKARKQMRANQESSKLWIHADSGDRFAQSARKRGVEKAPTSKA